MPDRFRFAAQKDSFYSPEKTWRPVAAADVMRVRKNWNLDVDAVDEDDWVTLNQDGHTLRIRVIKAALPSGEIETLLTHLTEEQLPAAEAGELYFKRWGIETAFDILKSKLQLENFSIKTEVGVKQDFYATFYLMGFAEICAAEATRSIEAADYGKDLKHKRKANMNRTINALRNHFWSILLGNDPHARHDLLTSFAKTLHVFLNLFGLVVARTVLSPEINVFRLLKNLSCLRAVHRKSNNQRRGTKRHNRYWRRRQ